MKWKMLLGCLPVLFFFSSVFAQQQDMKGWQLLDPSKDSIYGISLSNTYQFLDSKKPKPVVVAVIDSGVDTTHEDLKNILWHNPKEIPGNGIDDDGNGYVDDVYGIDTVNHDSDPFDDEGHGTHTAGTIAAVGNNTLGVVGVNWNAKLLACKFLSADGEGSDAGATECFNYIVAMRTLGENIRVSSNSW